MTELSHAKARAFARRANTIATTPAVVNLARAYLSLEETLRDVLADRKAEREILRGNLRGMLARVDTALEQEDAANG